MSRRTTLTIALAAGCLSLTRPAAALTINPTFDSSITTNLSASDAASFVTAINYADAQFAAKFTDPITINITFKSNAGTTIFGQSGATGVTVSNYTAMKTILTNDKKTPDDNTAIANLPASDPSGGAVFVITSAQGKALSLLTGNAPAQDGTVTIGSGFSFSYDSANRGVPGKYDFIGVAEHEISEVMGRYGDANLGGGHPGPLDLFGYQFGAGGTGTGVLNLTPNQDNNYFCIDGGTTPLHLNNNHANGEDNKDWGIATNDAFNAFSNSGVINDISAVDIREMDVIGYDAVVPEPATASLLATAGSALLLRRRRGQTPA